MDDLQPRSADVSSHDRGREPETAELERMNLIGRSPAFLQTVELIRRLAACDATTLITGETGTGKEVAARAVHYLSVRSGCPFIPVHCGALPDGLLETELFGHERGAFTDAKERRAGLIKEAEGGTLFLDEVEALTPRAQVVLLRFLQDQKYRAVGGRTLFSTNLRIVAATNSALEELVERGLFRQDLWFRLRVLELTLPALRERQGDAELLARHFLARFSETYRRPAKQLLPETVAWLEAHAWPGNVRELESLMLREFLLRDGDEILVTVPARRTTSVLPPASTGVAPTSQSFAFKPAKARAIAEFERAYLRQLLSHTGGNISRAALLAKKDRSALNKLVRKHRLLHG
ncbi:MAG TPA: sigma-54 dependent transcriptional regulator [Polyangiaceae bacterium]|nr:sigma-54 dependent transcriptional regulator [Polyangiaceae bacterium]